MIPNASLKKFNSFGIDSHCAYLSFVRTAKDVSDILERASPKKLFVLGGGSNVLLPDFLNAWVIMPQIETIELLEDSAESVLVRVGAGLNWHEFVMTALEKGWGGLENLSLIPGKVGAAPIQNIGAYGVEVKDFVRAVHFIDLYKNEKRVLSAEECSFGYRDSIFKHELSKKVLITKVDLELPKIGSYELNTSYGAIQEQLDSWNISEPSAIDVSKTVIHIRRSKLPDPKTIGNAGSFFKNPIISQDELERLISEFHEVIHYPIDDKTVKIPAGWLIDQCGWKGKREGAVGCYEKQALVIVNHNGATSSDIRNFARKVQKSVMDKFGIELEREVNYVG